MPWRRSAGEAQASDRRARSLRPKGGCSERNSLPACPAVSRFDGGSRDHRHLSGPRPTTRSGGPARGRAAPRRYPARPRSRGARGRDRRHLWPRRRREDRVPACDLRRRSHRQRRRPAVRARGQGRLAASGNTPGDRSPAPGPQDAGSVPQPISGVQHHHSPPQGPLARRPAASGRGTQDSPGLRRAASNRCVWPLMRRP